MKNKSYLRKIKPIKSKKGVSIIIEYVLLVVFAIVMGLVVYKFIKTMVPGNDLNCPDGTSLLIESYSYDCDSKILTLDILNNGRFDVGGYFIYATDAQEKELATIDLTQYNLNRDSILSPSTPGIKFGEYTSGSKNALGPNLKESEDYDVSSINDRVHMVEIVPIRWQVEKRKMILMSCKDAVVKKTLECD